MDPKDYLFIFKKLHSAKSLSKVSIALIHLLACIKWSKLDNQFPSFQSTDYCITFERAYYYFNVLGHSVHDYAARRYLEPLTEMYLNFAMLSKSKNKQVHGRILSNDSYR